MLSSGRPNPNIPVSPGKRFLLIYVGTNKKSDAAWAKSRAAVLGLRSVLGVPSYSPDKPRLRVLKSEPVCAELQESVAPVLGKISIKSVMKTESQCYGAFTVQRREVARDTDFLEGMVLLKIAEGAGVASAILKPRNAPLRTNFYSLGYKSIGGGLVPMRNQRQDVHKAGNTIAMNKLDEADQFAAAVCSKELALIQKGSVFAAKHLQAFSIMPERPTLPNGRFVVDRLDSTNKVIAKFGRADFNPNFLGFAYHVSSFAIDLFFPPMLVRAEK